MNFPFKFMFIQYIFIFKSPFIFNKDLYHIDSTIPLDSISDSKLYQLIYAINKSHGLLPLYKQQLNELIDSMLDSIIELNIAKPTITNSDDPSEDEE